VILSAGDPVGCSWLAANSAARRSSKRSRRSAVLPPPPSGTCCWSFWRGAVRWESCSWLRPRRPVTWKGARWLRRSWPCLSWRGPQGSASRGRSAPGGCRPHAGPRPGQDFIESRFRWRGAAFSPRGPRVQQGAGEFGATIIVAGNIPQDAELALAISATSESPRSGGACPFALTVVLALPRSGRSRSSCQTGRAS